MNDVVLYAFRHNAWATGRLIVALGALSAEQLLTTVPGVFGDSLSTLDHILKNERRWGYVLAEGDAGFEHLPAPLSLAECERRARDVAGFWERFFAEPIDSERVVARHWPDGARDELTVGVVLAQVLHHGNVHREQVSAILTALGFTPPEIDALAFGEHGGLARMYFRD